MPKVELSLGNVNMTKLESVAERTRGVSELFPRRRLCGTAGLWNHCQRDKAVFGCAQLSMDGGLLGLPVGPAALFT